MAFAWALALATCASLVAAVGSATAQDVFDRTSERLVGPVHVVAGERWTADGPGVEGDAERKAIDTVTFDAAGRVTSRDIIDDYGFPVGRETFVYAGARLQARVLRDTKGKLLERRTLRYASGDRPAAQAVTAGNGSTYEERYTRGVAGRLDRTTYFHGRAERAHTVYRYGDGPEWTEVAYFLGRDTPATAPVGPCLGAHRVTSVHRGGRIVEQAMFETDGSAIRTSTYQYDARGNVTGEVRTSPWDVTRLSHVYEYDARGNWTRRTTTVTSERRTARFVTVTRRTLTYF